MAKIVNDYVYKKGNLKLNDGINLSDNLQFLCTIFIDVRTNLYFYSEI